MRRIGKTGAGQGRARRRRCARGSVVRDVNSAVVGGAGVVVGGAGVVVGGAAVLGDGVVGRGRLHQGKVNRG